MFYFIRGKNLEICTHEHGKCTNFVDLEIFGPKIVQISRTQEFFCHATGIYCLLSFLSAKSHFMMEVCFHATWWFRPQLFQITKDLFCYLRQLQMFIRSYRYILLLLHPCFLHPCFFSVMCRYLTLVSQDSHHNSRLLSTSVICYRYF